MSVSCATCTIPSERMGKRALRLAFISLALAVIVLGTTALVVWRHEGYVEIHSTCCADHQHYLAMAGGLPEHPEAAKTPPYAYRLLSPLIVRLLPFSATTGFHLLTTAALIGAAALLFLLLRTMGFDDLAAAAGLMIFGSLYWLVESTQVDFLLVDPLTFFLFVTFLLALYRNLPPPLIAAIASLAVLNKEVGLILPLVALVYLSRTQRLTKGSAILIVGAPVLTFAVLHLLVATEGSYRLLEEIRDALSRRYGSPSRALTDLELYFFPTWGPMLLIIAAQPQSLVKFLRRFPELGVLYLLAHLQFLLAMDTTRLLVVAYVAVVPAVTFCLREGLRKGWLVLAVASAAAVVQGFYFEFARVKVATYMGGRSGFDPGIAAFEERAIIAMAVLAIVVAIVALLATLRSGGANNRRPQPAL